MVSRAHTAGAGILLLCMTDHLRPLLRNAVDVLPEGALAKRLAEAETTGRPLRIKLGVGAGLNQHFGAAEWRLVAGIDPPI